MTEVLTLLYIIAIDKTIKMLLDRVNGTFIGLLYGLCHLRIIYI